MKVLIVSHACVVDVNQELFVELAKIEDLKIALVIPSVFNTDLRGNLRFSVLSNFDGKIFAMRPLFAGKNRLLGNKGIHLYFYPYWWKPVREFKPDIIHIDEEPWSLSALQFALSGKRSDAKVLFYSKQNILKQLPFPFSIFERAVFRISSCAITLTEEVRQVLCEKGYKNQVLIVPHGIELKSFHPTKRTLAVKEELKLNSFIVGYIGRLTEEKGIIDLVRCLSILSRKGVKFQALIVGSGPCKEKVKRTVDVLGLNGLIKIIPAVPHNEIWKYYNCVDILVVPSHTTKSWKEQFGRVLIEAMACGVPVIGSSSGEIPNIIRKTGGGLIFQEKNIKDLAAKICELLKDEKKRKEFGRRGREKVTQLYSNEVVARQFYEVYKQLLSDK